MSDLTDFLHSPVLRNPSTWMIGAAGAGYGGFEMYMLREAKREAGAELQFPSLWMERTVDFLFGATCQIVIFLCAVWIVAVLIKHPNVWIRQLAVATVYLGCALLVKMV